MKKGRFTRPLRLSRNYSFADKQERTVGVPKSSESSYTETFSLQKFKKGDTCCPLFEHFAEQMLFHMRAAARNAEKC